MRDNGIELISQLNEDLLIVFIYLLNQVIQKILQIYSLFQANLAY